MSFVKSIFNFLRFNKRNWKAVVLCLFTATVFWFFNALNKNHSANINFPLAFDYDQTSYIPVKPLPDHIKVNVSGIGWDLFRKSSGLKVPPLVIPLEKPGETKKIVGSTLPPLFSNQLNGLQINFVLTDTIFVDLDERIRRKVKIKVDSAGKFIHSDFGISSEILISPDTVWIDGPKRIVSKLENTVMLALPRRNINRNYTDEVVLSNNELVHYQPEKVEVSFSVEKLMEVNDRIPIKIMNAPNRMKIALDVSEVNCTYRLPESLISTLTSDSLRAVIDLHEYARGKQTVAPQIIGLPLMAQVIKVDSVRINY